MSRIDDSDNQRIKEMQDTELRNRVDREKRDTDVRVTKSFQEVMQDRNQRQGPQKQGPQRPGQEQAARQEGEKQVLNRLLQRNAKPGSELQKRALTSNALHSSLAKARSADSKNVQRAEADRTEELTRKVDDEKERIDKDVRESDDTELRRAEEKDAAFRRINPDEGQGDSRSGERQGGRGGREQGEGSEERGPRSIQAAEAKPAQGSSSPPRIAQEVIDRIVGAIQSAHTADGRTEIHVDLKGTLLDGVRLEVRAQDGKVSCKFKGCTRDMKALLESSKGALMRGLAKKGMTLTKLEVA